MSHNNDSFDSIKVISTTLLNINLIRNKNEIGKKIEGIAEPTESLKATSAPAKHIINV